MSDVTDNMKSSSKNSSIKENESTAEKLGLDNPALWYSGGFIALFVSLALVNAELLSTIVNSGFAWAVSVFGPYWQILLLLTFLIGLGLAAGRTGRVILGGSINLKWTDSAGWRSSFVLYWRGRRILGRC